MSEVGECFVCGVSLAQGGKPRAEVSRPRLGVVTKNFCMRCWEKVSEALELYTDEGGISYVLAVKYWGMQTLDEEG